MHMSKRFPATCLHVSASVVFIFRPNAKPWWIKFPVFYHSPHGRTGYMCHPAIRLSCAAPGSEVMIGGSPGPFTASSTGRVVQISGRASQGEVWKGLSNFWKDLLHILILSWHGATWVRFEKLLNQLRTLQKLLGVRLAASLENSSYFAQEMRSPTSPQLFNVKPLKSHDSHPCIHILLKSSNFCDSCDAYPPLVLASILHPRGLSLGRTSGAWSSKSRTSSWVRSNRIQSSFQYVSIRFKTDANKTLMSQFWSTLAFDPSHPQPLNLQAFTRSVGSNVAGKSQGKGHFLPPTCDLDVALRKRKKNEATGRNWASLSWIFQVTTVWTVH